MTYQEFIDWVEYRSIRGPLISIQRLEQQIAQQTLVHLRMNGDKETTLYDLLPFEEKPKENVELSFDQFRTMMQGL
ncbi:phage tail assembly protein T [Salinicola sp. V024]|uniref:phage tail assembly protein T n=1 Tax=Salinicola sp. V024 TaxID=3459609 RepID=UPI004044DA8F